MIASSLPELDIRVVHGVLDATCQARVRISLYSSRTSGACLDRLCTWLRDQGISDLELQVSDTLQRHNLIWRKKAGPGRAEALSKTKGDLWIRRNKQTIGFCAKAFNRFVISRWEYWLDHRGYPEALDFVKSLMDTDAAFREAVEKEASAYFLRVGHSLTLDRLELSKNFILEELAVSIVTSTFDPRMEIYPGSVMRPERHIATKYPDKIRDFDRGFVSVQFVPSA